MQDSVKSWQKMTLSRFRGNFTYVDYQIVPLSINRLILKIVSVLGVRLVFRTNKPFSLAAIIFPC